MVMRGTANLFEQYFKENKHLEVGSMRGLVLMFLSRLKVGSSEMGSDGQTRHSSGSSTEDASGSSRKWSRVTLCSGTRGLCTMVLRHWTTRSDSPYVSDTPCSSGPNSDFCRHLLQARRIHHT